MSRNEEFSEPVPSVENELANAWYLWVRQCAEELARELRDFDASARKMSMVRWRYTRLEIAWREERKAALAAREPKKPVGDPL